MIEYPQKSTLFVLIIICVTVSVLAGCGKSVESKSAGPALQGIALVGPDLNANGTIAPEALKRIEAIAEKSPFSVGFVRTTLSDAGLSQLAKFHNLRRVDAIGSKLSDEAISKLKAEIPEVEVYK